MLGVHIGCVLDHLRHNHDTSSHVLNQAVSRHLFPHDVGCPPKFGRRRLLISLGSLLLIGNIRLRLRHQSTLSDDLVGFLVCELVQLHVHFFVQIVDHNARATAAPRELSRVVRYVAIPTSIRDLRGGWDQCVTPTLRVLLRK